MSFSQIPPASLVKEYTLKRGFGLVHIALGQVIEHICQRRLDTAKLCEATKQTYFFVFNSLWILAGQNWKSDSF